MVSFLRQLFLLQGLESFYLDVVYAIEDGR